MAKKATFDLNRSSDDQFYFVLVSTNGEPIAHSEMYTTKQAAKKGIKAVRKHASDAEIDDKT